jgi:hypothetical protein
MQADAHARNSDTKGWWRGQGGAAAHAAAVITGAQDHKSLDMQQAIVGRSAAEIERLRFTQERMNEATRLGISLTPQMAEQIAALGDRAALAALDAEALQQRLEFSQEIEGLGKDVLKGFISDLRQGTSAAEASAMP